MYDGEKRKTWDINAKEYKIYENNENYAIYKYWMFSPVFFISERDVIDKKIQFIHDGVFYYISTSVDNYSEVNPEVVRCLTYLNSTIISEDDDNFYFNTLTQLDAKVL